MKPIFKYDINTLKKYMPTVLPNIVEYVVKFVDYVEDGKCELDLDKFFELGYYLKENEKYKHYRLENFFYNQPEERVEILLENYLSEKTDRSLSHDELYTALQNSLELANKMIIDVLEDDYKNTEIYKEAYKKQLEMFKNAKSV